MKDNEKTIGELVNELSELRSQNSELKQVIARSISADLVNEESNRHTENIVETVREPLLVLNEDLKIISANSNFYKTFKVNPGETIGSFIYDLGNKQWDIPKLRELLEEVLPEKQAFDDFEVSHMFEVIGHKIMLLNAREIYRKDISKKLILLAIEDITEHKRLESLLTESEERYRRLFETASDGIVLLEKREGSITHANPATEKMLGYTNNESVGNNLKGIGVLLDMDDFQTTMQNLNKSGILNYNDVQVITKSGRHIDTDIYLVDRARLVQCNIRNITERKQAGKEIQLNELRLRVLLDILQHPSETIQDFLDYALEQAIQMTGSKIGYIYHYHEDRKEFVLNTWSREVMMECTVAKPSTCYELEKTGIWGETVRQRCPIIINDFQAAHPLKKGYPEGHVQLLKFLTVPIFRGVNIVGVVGVANKEADYEETDIIQVSLLMEAVWKVTERKQAEEEKQNTQRLLTISQRLAHIGSWETEMSTGKLSWSEEMYRILGFPDSSPVYLDMALSVFPPDELIRFREAVDSAIRGDAPYNIDYAIILHDGQSRIIHEEGEVLFDEHGTAVRMQGTTQDITEHRQAEEEKAKLEIQLLQTHKMEAIGTLAGGIAHDFNNILAAMIGYTELSLAEDQKEIQHQYLQEALKGAERAKDLVKQILTFSRQDSHEKKPLDIKLLLKEAIKFLRASIPTTIEIRQYFTDKPCNIMADATQMHQTIMNLCTNAAHAMKQTGGVLKIELSTLELVERDMPINLGMRTGPYIKLTISDTGHGIDPILHKRIFDPFFTTKSKGEGTGLGLSVVYGIVRSHDGAINVYSEPGKGASFNIYLPRIIHEDVTSGIVSGTIIGGTERILLVDDEQALVNMGKRMLFSLGYEVTGVTSSLEALDLFRFNPMSFDLVITDMTLPKMTGIDLSREILQIRPEIPIILCSGIRESGTEEQVKSLGIRAYCMKPLTRRELSQVIRDILDGHENPVS